MIFFFALLFLVFCRNDPDYYGIFDMNRKSFSKEKLHKAYRKLAKTHHPDKNPGNKEAEAKFVEITKAFEILNDDQKRRIYDQFGAEAVEKHMNGGGGGGGGHYDFHHAEDIFNSYRKRNIYHILIYLDSLVVEVGLKIYLALVVIDSNRSVGVQMPSWKSRFP